MKRFALIVEVATVMFLCAGGASLSHLWKQGPLSLEVAVVALLIPAISAILLICLSVAIPELYATNRLMFPITVTLPLIYTAILSTSSALLTRVGVSITKVPDRLQAMNVWSNFWLLVWTCLAGIICLVVLGALARERQGR